MKTVTANGVEIAFRDEGRGTPLLLVHGFPLDHTMWKHQIEGLSSVCRVIAPDLRGFGRSRAMGAKVTMERLADDLAALVDALGAGEPIVFCGLSMGGYVAWEFWKKYRAGVRGLVLCDTRAAADSPEAAAGRRETARRVLAEGPAFLVDAMVPKLLAPGASATRPDLIESLSAMIRSANAQGVAAAALGMAERDDASTLLPRIDCPCLVVVGQYDAISPPDEMRAIAESIPGAQWVAVSDAGHMAPMENPDQVNAAIAAFLDGLSR